jgi:hypothetical protein
LAQDQEPKGTGGDAHTRWDVLIVPSTTASPFQGCITTLILELTVPEGIYNMLLLVFMGGLNDRGRQ